MLMNYKIGINTFLFASPFTNKETALFSRFRSWGFDGVELAIEDPAHIDPAFVRAQLDASGLTCTSVCAAMGPGRDLRGTDAEQTVALRYLESLIEMMPVLGCPILVGPLYSVVGRIGAETNADKELQQRLVADNLRRVADFAQARNVLIAIEPLNRYETDFINTAEQAVSMIRAVNHPALKVHLDTFHMNIEEKHPGAAIKLCGGLLGHVHACGSDRGAPGGDHTNWPEIMSALDEAGYKGSLVIESFTPDVQVIARAASIWRQIDSSQEGIATEGLKFLRRIA
jgi:D-psicose/D-tagatose/L-ribulose 3-epimerase